MTDTPPPSSSDTNTTSPSAQEGGVNLNAGKKLSARDIIGHDKVTTQTLLSILVERGSTITLQFLPTKTAFALIFTLFLSAGIWAYLQHVSQQPRVMTGDFNIAIAQFGEVTEQGVIPSTIANQISQRLAIFLQSEYKLTDFGLAIQVTHHNIGIITEPRDAEQLAQAIGADLVVYGTVFLVGDDADFSPQFYLATESEFTSDVGEITGPHELEAPIRFNTLTLNSQDKVNSELQSRASILVNFTKGLIHLSGDHYAAAKSSFLKAIEESRAGESQQGLEVLYLFAAISAYQQDEFQEAHKLLDELMTQNPEYARGYIARGNVYYIQGTQPIYNDSLLQQAISEYKRALGASDQTTPAYVEEKANIQLGHIYNYQATNQPEQAEEYYQEALDAYQVVISRYQQTQDPSLRELAASAYLSIGITYEKQDQYVKAKDNYERCLVLTENEVLESTAQRRLNGINN